MIFRLFVKKKSDSPMEKKIRGDIFSMLGIKVESLTRVLRYDIENIEESDLEKAKFSVFAEKPVDELFYELTLKQDEKLIITEFLPGQFDQRADSAMQCVQLLTGKNRPLIRCSTLYIIKGVNQDQLEKIKKLLINPVESREGSSVLPETLKNEAVYSFKPDIIENFIESKDLTSFYKDFGFAMTLADLIHVQKYFASLKRNPTLTELKVIDTYWSDHCRHTTFLTELKNVEIDTNIEPLKETYEKYLEIFDELYKDRPDKYKCLMDVATIIVKKLKKEGYLKNLDASDEINACSIKADVDVNGENEKWLIMFKNETHNHPTEIEPFGGAATCLGGAIRDPLSGRSYVYQAMRVSGSGDPRESIEDTIPGKLPQRVITKTAAAGFSSYGNQIGLAAGEIKEIYHPGYKAKRLETGYVIGGAPAKNVVRKAPQAGDAIILVGGDTGRDGCGGATGSSKSHTASSVEECGAEVQKGNAPEERKLQRFFRTEKVSRLIKKCNDFGAGGVCVAIGELADGLDIWLDRVPTKTGGLTPTELAISESQERMAVVVAKEDMQRFISYAEEENLKATFVAEVKKEKRLKMYYHGNIVVDIERAFLDTNGVKQEREVFVSDNYNGYFEKIEKETVKALEKGDITSALKSELGRLNVCSTKGLGDKFDSTIGAGSVLLPFGGKNQITPAAVMASKPPVLNGNTSTVTVSAHAYYPYLMSESCFIGAIYSVVGSISKLVSAGVPLSDIHLSFQEYFPRPGSDKKRWGMPLSALLGAFNAEYGLKIAAIGGKDSMSGSFENLDVPPTLISFGMGIAKEENIRHNAFDKEGKLYLFRVPADKNHVPDYEKLTRTYSYITKKIAEGEITHTAVAEEGGILSAIAKSLLGNDMGFTLKIPFSEELFRPLYGCILAVSEKELDGEYLGDIDSSGTIKIDGKTIPLSALKESFTGALEPVFKTYIKQSGEAFAVNYTRQFEYKAHAIIKGKPKVFIPVFPGTNCEYDTAAAFERNGAEADIFVVKNYSPSSIAQSIEEIRNRLSNAQIIAFPGGFSGGDEPDGSGKFIATTFKNPFLKDALNDLLYSRGGLALGICNGFQALIKLGLLPYGEICDQDENAPTLTFNTISKHVSTISRIRISSNASPWLQSFETGEVYSVPVSHGEGRFVCNEKDFQKLSLNGQIATQYVDLAGNVTMEYPHNPNGSYCAVEGILSPKGNVLGKMGHTERAVKGLYKNVPGSFDMNIFRNGVKYFK